MYRIQVCRQNLSVTEQQHLNIGTRLKSKHITIHNWNPAVLQQSLNISEGQNTVEIVKVGRISPYEARSCD